MAMLQIEVEPTPTDVRILEDRLYEYNAERTGFDDGKWLSIFVRDDNGEIAAGIHGWTWGGSGKIQTLWVRRELRGHGYGTRLVRAAEEEATARGCEQLFLDTFSFQAPLFYQKLGYEVVGVLENFPSPHKLYLLRKQLGSRQGPSA